MAHRGELQIGNDTSQGSVGMGSHSSGQFKGLERDWDFFWFQN